MKLGKTRGGNDVDATIRGLKSRYATALIDPDVLVVMRTNDCGEAEKVLFEELAMYRLKSQREVFVFDVFHEKDVDEKMKTIVSDVILPAMEKACHRTSEYFA